MTERTYLPSSFRSSKSKIRKIETVVARDWMSDLLLLRIHTSDGLAGHGETFYGAGAVASLIHDWMSSRLLESDPLAIESHWRFFYERFANFGGFGAELRAISAVDLALWDILGQSCGLPIYRLLGGPVREQVRLYNSCGNPSYGKAQPGQLVMWPGYGGIGTPGPLSDSYNLWAEPAALARELVEEGWGGVKLWPFDSVAHRDGGAFLSLKEARVGVAPLHLIREAVGDSLEIMVDGHGFFLLPAALRIAEALRDIRPLWMEDVLKTDNVAALAGFRRQAQVPVSVSEMILRRSEYLEVLAQGAADWIQLDPTWCGGISETVRLARLAEAYNVPVTMHDCTGPLTWLAGLHVNASVACCAWQETVRAHVRSFYSEIINPNVTIDRGWASLPEGPGLGAVLNPDLFTPANPTYRCSG